MSEEGMTENRINTLSKNGCPVVAWTVRISELFVKVWPQTGDHYDGSGTLLRVKFKDLLLSGVHLSASQSVSLLGSTLVILLTGRLGVLVLFVI